MQLLHTPWAWRYIHHIHHQFLTPTPFAQDAVHPVEGIVQGPLGHHLITLFTPIHPAAHAFLGFVTSVYAIGAHDGTCHVFSARTQPRNLADRACARSSALAPCSERQAAASTGTTTSSTTRTSTSITACTGAFGTTSAARATTRRSTRPQPPPSIERTDRAVHTSMVYSSLHITYSLWPVLAAACCCCCAVLRFIAWCVGTMQLCSSFNYLGVSFIQNSVQLYDALLYTWNSSFTPRRHQR